MQMSEYAMGILGGVLVALILWLFYAKKTGAVRQKAVYDERQIAIQGKGYKIAYSMTLIGLFFLGSTAVFVEHMPSMWLAIGAMALLFASVSVFAVYCISRGAFVGLRQRWKSYIFLYLAVVATNLVSFLVNRANMAAGLLVDSDMTNYTLWINLMLVASFSVVLVALLIARAREQRGDFDEES